MATLLAEEMCGAVQAIDRFMAVLATMNITIEIHRDFSLYASIRRAHGDVHLNQAFDPKYTWFSEYDFWLLARWRNKDVIAACCSRRFITDDFYRLIRTQALWFSRTPSLIKQQLTIDCDIAPFGGEIIYGGGLWVRHDLRGSSRLAFVLPRLGRALSLRERAFDHDTAMILSAAHDSPKAAERKAVFTAKRIYGCARVSRFVEGWFPPEGRKAIMHLCHSTKAEAIASLLDQVPGGAVIDLYSSRLNRDSRIYWQHSDIGQSSSLELKPNEIAASLDREVRARFRSDFETRLLQDRRQNVEI
jgi:hypothetical protein